MCNSAVDIIQFMTIISLLARAMSATVHMSVLQALGPIRQPNTQRECAYHAHLAFLGGKGVKFYYYARFEMNIITCFKDR